MKKVDTSIGYFCHNDIPKPKKRRGFSLERYYCECGCKQGYWHYIKNKIRRKEKTNLEIIKNILEKLKKALKNGQSIWDIVHSGGLCGIAQDMLSENKITEKEFYNFIEIIYNYREKYAKYTHKSSIESIFFFEYGKVKPRIKFLENIMKELKKVK